MTPFTRSVTEIIVQRYSCRSYIERPIDGEVRTNLTQFAGSLAGSSNGLQARFELVAARASDFRALKHLGTYGFIHGASGFLIGGTSDGEAHLEAFGSLMERWVLLATDLGLGTCWLGGTFTKSSFARKFGASEGELIPAVIAVGYPAPRRRAIERLIRHGAVADRRYAWSRLFFHETFAEPLSPAEAGDYAQALEMVRLGPSASNKQPWRIVRQGDRWHFYLQRTPGYREGLLNRMFTQADLQRIDMGIAMCHFELTAAEQGHKGEWLYEEPGLEKPDELTEYSVSWLEKSA